MTTVVVRRGPRRPAPEIPSGSLPVDPPPELPPPAGRRWAQWLMVLPMLTGTLATALMFAGRDKPSGYSYIVGALFGISSLSMLALSFGGGAGRPRKAELIQARRDYLRHLAALRRRVRPTIARQRHGLWYRHPDPHQLWSTVASYRLWERRPGDSDFAVVRIGVGPQTLATPLQPPATRPLDDLEPLTANALRRFIDAYSVVPDLPVAVALRGFTRVILGGDGAAALARAVVAQLATFHAPDDLLIAVCADESRRAGWEWTKWLPHAWHPNRRDAVGPRRLVTTSPAELVDLLDAIPVPVVAIVDGGSPVPARAGVTWIEIGAAAPRSLDPDRIGLDVTEGRLHLTTVDERADVGVADALSEAEVEALARQLAPLRLAAPKSGPDDGPSPDSLISPPAPRTGRELLRVTIGSGTDGQPVELDLKESAQEGMGPHGLLIGATGSGKSELLRTIVLGLAATHSSETLNLVLVDFKGGATFASLDRLPHTAAVITNLADELPLVDRMTDALNGELVRRQEVLRRAGNYASVRDYERARAGGAVLPPLPVLLVVCDEFAELLSAKPDFIDLFVQIGRLGRSLGVHLLLASQRLDEGRLRGLDTHLSYRIGLRTFSALESRAVLGVPDAYELPRSPGHGYLRYGTEPLIRFRASYVSAPYHRHRADGVRERVLPYGTQVQPVPDPPSEPAADGESLLDVVVDRLAGTGPPAHRVWLPPLASPPGLDELLGPLIRDPIRGLTVTDPASSPLTVPVAIVDKPFDQRRDVLRLHLAGASGHVAVVGGPRSGKSTVVTTLIAGLSLAHTPAEAQVYCLDFGGGTLTVLSGLPHVGGVAQRQDTAAVRRTVAEIGALLADRERRSATGDAHVFLVVDGWATLRGDYPEMEAAVTDLANRGLSYGVHVVATASRWTDFRPAIRDMFGSRLELRLGDPADSIVARRVALDVPDRTPGRGVTMDGFHLLTALPRVTGLGPGGAAPTDCPGATCEHSHGIAELVAAVAGAWSGAPAPRVRLLPDAVGYPEIEDIDPGGLALPIGLAETDLGPVCLDFAADPHLLLLGDAEAGKSSFLRALATTITRRHPPERARIVLVDYRRSLAGDVRTDHLIGYATTAVQARELIESVADHLDRRRADGDWTGPECFVLVDDYDLVATGPANPLLPLLDHLAVARDVGLHLVLTRRCGGAGRAMYEPIMQRLRDLASPGVVMSGDPEEGALIGSVRPAPLPPGRGWLVSRREGVRLIQLAHLPAG